MKKSLALSILSASLTSALAADSLFETFMDGAQAGGGARTGTGTGTFELTGASMAYTINYSGLSGTSVNNAHIHIGPVGVQGGPVVHGFTGPFTAPAGTISGTWNNMTAQNISDLNAGLFYVNIHTLPNFPGGEIRGQITAVPEPSTWALLAAGGFAAALHTRKRLSRSRG
jgi:hypothetical protein